MVIVKLANGVSVAKITEVLTRIGIGNNTTNILYPSCYYFELGTTSYIGHFKELIALEKNTNALLDKGGNGITTDDINRRDNIIELLEGWGLLSIVSEGVRGKPKQNFKILKFYDKVARWEIKHKYTM